MIIMPTKFSRGRSGVSAEKGDVLIAITTSGKSKNVLRALEEAKRKGVESICHPRPRRRIHEGRGDN